MRRTPTVVVALVTAVVLAGCGGGAPLGAQTPSPVPGTSPAPPSPSPSSPSSTSPPTPEPGTVAPEWLGTRVLPVDEATGFGVVRRTPAELRERRFTLPGDVEPLPGDGFASDVVSPAPADVIERSTWEPGCPVAAEDLSWARVTFRGFDGERHTGELLLATPVADDVVGAFGRLWEADVPIEEMRVTRAEELDASPTGDGNNTAAFVCRAVVGGSTPSQHAFGLAVDVNPFQNPYTRGDDVVLPELASAYLDRDWRRPGMYDADSAVVRAFADIGWTWGGTWRTAQDRHHFSLTGG